MGPEFGRLGPHRGKLHKARLFFYFVGTTLCAASILAVLILIYSRDPAIAKDTNRKADRLQSEQISYGTIMVVVPETTVPQGTRLTQVKLTTKPWPRNEVPMGAVFNEEDVKQLYAKVALAAEQPVVNANLSPTPVLGGVVELIPPGHRAITIDVDATSSVEGWAFPGAHVDVLVTYRDPEDGVNKTRVAIEDAVVLSFDGSTQREDRESGARVSQSSTVTLAVAAQETLKVRTAQAIGRISLVLRSSDDIKGIGPEAFAATDFEQQKRKQNRNMAAAPQGFARFTDEQGVEHEFTLGADKRWFGSSAEEGN